MSFALVSLEFVPRGEAGWSSNRLVFGDFLTLVRGPNDSGKTPILEGIAYALGNPAELPVEVRSACSAVVLEMKKETGETARVTRQTDRLYPVNVQEVGKDVELGSAGAWSEWWLAFAGIPNTTLTSKGKAATVPYAGTLLPYFWVDQDTGWRYLYTPLPNQNFILAQEEETTRLILGLAPKRIFRSQEDYDAAKRDVEALVAQVDARRRTVENLRRESGVTSSQSVEVLEEERRSLIRRLESLQSAADAVRAGGAQYDTLLQDLRNKQSQSFRRAAYLGEQKRQIEQAAAEIAGDAELLSHNVVAQQTFRRFCGHENCRLFADSEAASYGRRLLFLGDQLKDLRFYAAGLEGDIAAAEEEAKALKRREVDVEAERTAELSRAGLQNYVTALQHASTELAAIDVRIARIREFLDQQRQFETLLSKLEAARLTVEDLRPGARRSEAVGVDAARATYQSLATKWLHILGTKVPDPLIAEDFRVLFGPDKFTESSPHSGSTRTRIVLALHAALLETSLRLNGHHPNVLILDAPRQHELASGDLVAFLEALRALHAEYKKQVQIVLAVVELDVDLRKGDVEWAPPFEIEGERRYLGPPAEA